MLQVSLASEYEGEATTPGIPGAEIVDQDAAKITIRFDPDQVSISDLMTYVIGQYHVSDIAIVEPDLESVVREIVEAGEVRA